MGKQTMSGTRVRQMLWEGDFNMCNVNVKIKLKALGQVAQSTSS